MAVFPCDALCVAVMHCSLMFDCPCCCLYNVVTHAVFHVEMYAAL